MVFQEGNVGIALRHIQELDTPFESRCNFAQIW